MKKSKFLQGKRIAPTAISKDISLVELIETTFQAYNAARLREGGRDTQRQQETNCFE